MDLLDDPSPGQNAHDFTVSELSGAVKRTIEGEFGRIRVKGEVGRVFKARSGHLYYDLKDDRNVLACTTWKGQIGSLGVTPEEGLEVVATGNLTTFGAQSKYNMNVDTLAVAGVGALMAMLEKRKKALAAEGLFDPARKKSLPFLPDVIGVVTSPSGAVIRDILHRLRDRFPSRVLIWPVAVQGQAAAGEVARAIAGFNHLTPGGALPRPDVLIVARGGGSIEDLWAFNEEVVARAVAASEIPLISAIGHETDTTLIDHVADHRAPTPTAAAERAVPVRLDLLAWVGDQGHRLSRSALDATSRRRQRLADLSRALPRPESLLSQARQQLDQADRQLPAALRKVTARQRLNLATTAARLAPQTLRQGLARIDQRLGDLDRRATQTLIRRTREDRQRLATLSARLRPATLTRTASRNRRDLGQLSAKLATQARQQTAARRDHLDALDRLRTSIGYEATLARGYAVVRGDGDVVMTQKAARKATELEIQFRDGRLKVAKADKAAAKPARKPAKPSGPDQGSLF